MSLNAEAQKIENRFQRRSKKILGIWLADDVGITPNWQFIEAQLSDGLLSILSETHSVPGEMVQMYKYPHDIIVEYAIHFGFDVDRIGNITYGEWKCVIARYRAEKFLKDLIREVI